MHSQKKYYFSTEGETEKWYLEHLQELINKDEQKVVFVIQKIRPKSFIKRINIVDKINIAHFFDIESNSVDDTNGLKQVLSEIRSVSNLGKTISYVPCYSNFTFELWLILHKIDCNGAKSTKKDYLQEINKAFGVKYQALREYKEEKHFKQILSKITLDDVKNAVIRAEKIMKHNAQNYTEQKYLTYKWYAENPATEAGNIIGQILKNCAIM